MIVRRPMYRLAIIAYLAVVATSAHARDPDYEAMVALRSSSGFEAALNAANSQLALNPRDATAAGVRALVYANAADFLGLPYAQVREAKREAIARALAISESNPWTRAAYGLIHMFDDPDAAERRLATCIESTPGFLECYNLYGDMLRKRQQLQRAGEIYQRALERWPKDGELLVSYALLLQQSGQVEATLDVLRALTREQPSFPRGHWHLAVVLYEAGGDRAIALQEARSALRLDAKIWNGKKLLELLDDTESPDDALDHRRDH